MMNNSVPDRWLSYSPMGAVIPDTRFFACKVPLKEPILRNLPKPQKFGPKDLMEAFPRLGLLIDLTNTTRYYFKEDFIDRNIKYEKIHCPGQVIPPNSIINKFVDIVNDFLKTNEDPEALIGVHCTHGVNRTGYFICRYMIQQMKILPELAIQSFQESRGHEIERDSYVNDLKNGCRGGSESDLRFTYGKQKSLGSNTFRRAQYDGKYEQRKVTDDNITNGDIKYSSKRRLFKDTGRRNKDGDRDEIMNSKQRRENEYNNSEYNQGESSYSNTQSRFKWTPNSAVTPDNVQLSWRQPYNPSEDQPHGYRRVYLPQQPTPPAGSKAIPQYGKPQQSNYPRVGPRERRSRRGRGYKRRDHSR